METLKFLFTTTFYPPYHIGGDAVHVKYLAEELARRGHEVHVLHSLDAYRIKRKNLPKKVETDGVYTHVIDTRFSLSPYAVYLLGDSSVILRKFQELIREIKPDIVHHHNISLLGYSLLKKQGNYLNLYTAHDYWLICQQNNLMRTRTEICDGNGFCALCALRRRRPPQLWRYSKGFKTAVNDVDLLISPSNYLREKILKSFNVKAVTIPNFAPEPPRDIKPSGFSNFFLYAGVLEEYKGVLNLIKAYEDISEEVEAKLIIVGDGSLKTKIEEDVKKNEMKDKILVLGFVNRNKLYSLLKDANALIIPSIWPENNPLIAVEALSVGTPIIASNKGGLPEIVGEIDKNLIYRFLDELKNVLLNFNKNKYPRCKIKAIYEKHYSPQSYIERYFSLIPYQTSRLTQV